MKRISLIALAIGILLIAFSSISCSQGGFSGVIRSLTIGSTNNEADTLIYIADEKGFFKENGLDVKIVSYSSGAVAAEGLLKGEVTMATASEFVIVQNAFKTQPLSAIAAISKFYNMFLVGNTDRGIKSIQDLVNKRIGVPGGTLAQFAFGRFMDLNGMSSKTMTKVSIDIAHSGDVMVNNEVDAVVCWEPFTSTIKEKLAGNVIIWAADSGQPQYKNVSGMNAWLRQNQESVKRFLKSLVQAETYLSNHPAEAKAIIRNRLKYTERHIDSIWPTLQSALSLDLSMIISMEDEARWSIRNGLTTEKAVPDFLDYIYEDVLKAVKPSAVNIIR